MTTSNEFRIAVLPGDGIGHEIRVPVFRCSNAWNNGSAVSNS